MNIKIFTTGGSIDKSYSPKDSTFIIGEPQIADILKEANVTLEYDIESLMKKDSLDLTDTDRKLIHDKVKADPTRHIIITHGTDTMTDTARALKDIPAKTIIITGAFQPASAKKTDAVFNVGAAISCVQTLPDGVYVVMNGRVFDPDKARKNPDSDTFEQL